MYKNILIPGFLLILFTLAGCSSGGDPVLPNDLTREEAYGGHQLWGLWQLAADPVAGTMEPIPLRESTFHINALPFLEPPEDAFITVDNVSFNGNIIEADVSFLHPFLGLPEYTGFDVNGILITTGSVSGFSDPNIVMPGEGDCRLLNADGYSRWWNPVEYPVNLGTIFSYNDGLKGTPHDQAQYNCTLNGFKYFSDALESNDDIDNLDPGPEWGQFAAGQKNTRHYVIDRGQDGLLIFNYAVDVNWKRPVGDPPYQIPGSFPEGAWKVEAWNVVVTEVNNSLWNDGVNSGGNLSLSIDVWDHFNSEQNTVLVESPGNLPPVSSDTPSDTGPGYSTYLFNIIGATPSEGSIPILISVESEALIANPFAYFVHEASVSDDPGKCEGVDETESNDTCDTADPVTVGVEAFGCVQEYMDEWDYWSFTVPELGDYNIVVQNDSAGDLDLSLYDGDCAWIATSGLNGAGENESMYSVPLNPGTYIVAIEADNDSGPYPGQRPYRLRVDVLELCFHETEPNPMGDPDIFGLDYDPDMDECNTGVISSQDDEDWFFFEPPLVSSGEWQIEVVDSEGDVGRTPKMDLDAEGNPHIVYWDFGSWKFKYARYDGIDWQVSTEFDSRHVNGMEIADNGLLHASYVIGDFEGLIYSWYDGVSWHPYTVDTSPGGTESALAVSDNYPHVAWDALDGYLFYKFKDADGWHEEFVYYGPQYPAIGAEVAIDLEGFPHIVHCQNYSPLELYHSWKDIDGWHTEVVDTPGYQGVIEIDSAGGIHIVYQNGSGIQPGKDLMYAYNPGSGWVTETVDDTGDMDNIDMIIDSQNRPHISYHDFAAGDLKYALKDFDGWQLETPDSEGKVGKGTSIRLLAGDIPCIAYYDFDNGNLKYAVPGEGGIHYSYPGYLTVALVGHGIPPGAELTISMFDENFSELDTKTINANDDGISVRLPYGGNKNQALYIKVSGSEPGLVYDLHPLISPEWSPSETFFETEPNNNSGGADLVPLDYDPDTSSDLFTGIFLSGNTSEDWYQFQTTDIGNFMLHVSDYDIAPGNEWVEFVLYDSSLSMLDATTLLHNDGSFVLRSGGVNEPSTYYLKMSTNTWTHRYVMEPIFVGG